MDKFKDTALKLLNSAREKLSKIDKKVKIGVLAGTAVIVVSLIVLAIIMGQTNYSVLYSGVSSTESSEICSYVRENLGIDDIKIQGDSILVPNEKVEDIRVELSIAGYPKSTFNYDIWNSGVSMTSTKTEIREVQRQQLESNLAATLRKFNGVGSATVILYISEESDYYLSTSEDESRASVALELRQELTNDQIIGIYNLVQNSVPGLERENITIVDGSGTPLLEVDENAQPDETQENTERLKLYYKRLEYQNNMTEILEDGLYDLFEGVYDKINVSVALRLNYDSMVQESVEYTPSVDEEGTSGGMISEEEYHGAAGGIAQEGGLVGTTIDADISPDYPTLTVGEDGEFYWEESKVIKRLVNEEKTQIEKDGYSIEMLSASVVVDDDQMTNQEKEELEIAVAYAIGADPQNVKVVGKKLTDSMGEGILDGDISIVGGGSNNTVILTIIIVLGVVLIVLLALALSATGSKKKRKVSHAMGKGKGKNRPEFATTAIPGLADDGGNIVSSPATARNAVEIPDAEFDLPSLNEEVPETRDAALKREIRDFSKTNPEIVAQLLRTWMRGDE